MLAHGFAGGESITISNASAVGGINTGQLNGARTVSSIIDENTFTFTAGGSASSAADTSFSTIPVPSIGEIW